MLSDVAVGIFKTLYSYNGETIEDTFKRVASCFGDEESQSLAYHYLLNNIWRPNTPVFFNAGKPKGKQICSACYVVPLSDSMDSIYDIVNVSRKIFQIGSGIGIPIGNLREKNAPIFESSDIVQGNSSGSINFMKLFDVVGDTTKSGGRCRRAAILCDMPIWHPDIEEFITSKDKDGTFKNMNISVAVTDNFMECLKDNIPYSIHTPYDGSQLGFKNPEEIWNKISEMAWKTGDPGIIFIDTVNKYNPLKSIILIEVSNPCSEQTLRPWECCSLSAINIVKFVKNDNTFDWEGLFEISYNVTELMDNLLDVQDYPDKRFKDATYKTRPVGIGFMGLADAMYLMDIKYNSKEGQNFAGEIMRTITHGGFRKSAELARDRGYFPLYKNTQVQFDTIEIIKKHIGGYDISHLENPDVEIVKTLELIKEYGVRNCQISTIQPTGTTALSCDCSYGMEPCFGLVFQKNFIDGKKTKIINEIFRKRFSNEPWYSDELLEKIIANNGSLKNIRGIPKEVKDVFVVAHDIKPKDRIDIQSCLQKYCSTAISSTINLPENATVEDVKNIYTYAYEKELKGITVYRDGCKENQPVTFTSDKEKNERPIRPTLLTGATYSLEMPDGGILITVNKDGDKVVEVVLNKGKSGTSINGLLEYIGRIISKSLQWGMSLEEVVKQGYGISGEEVCWLKLQDSDTKPVQIKSIPDALSKLLKRFYIDGHLETHKTLGISVCPVCKSETLTFSEGCQSCLSCGFSKCS